MEPLREAGQEREVGQRGCGSCHCLGDTAELASSPGRQHLGSMWSRCPQTQGWARIVAAPGIPLWCGGTSMGWEHAGLEQPLGWWGSRADWSLHCSWWRSEECRCQE